MCHKLFISTKHFAKVLCCLLHIILHDSKSNAQINLVPNPSFEQYTNCPDNSTLTGTKNSKPDFWYKPDVRNGGYLNACSNGTGLGGGGSFSAIKHRLWISTCTNRHCLCCYVLFWGWV